MFTELSLAFGYVAFIYSRNRLPVPSEIVFGVRVSLVFVFGFAVMQFLDPFLETSTFYYGGAFIGAFLLRNIHPAIMTGFRIYSVFASIYILSFFIALKTIGMFLFFIPTYHLLKV